MRSISSCTCERRLRVGAPPEALERERLVVSHPGARRHEVGGAAERGRRLW